MRIVRRIEASTQGVFRLASDIHWSLHGFAFQGFYKRGRFAQATLLPPRRSDPYISPV